MSSGQRSSSSLLFLCFLARAFAQPSHGMNGTVSMSGDFSSLSSSVVAQTSMGLLSACPSQVDDIPLSVAGYFPHNGTKSWDARATKYNKHPSSKVGNVTQTPSTLITRTKNHSSMTKSHANPSSIITPWGVPSLLPRAPVTQGLGPVVASAIAGAIVSYAESSQSATATTTSTTVPSARPTYAIQLSNNTVAIGDAWPQGGNIASTMFNDLKGKCNINTGQCDSTQTVTYTVPVVIDDASYTEDINFVIESSKFDSEVSLDRMLAASIASWLSSASQSGNCKAVSYQYDTGLDIDCPTTAKKVKRDGPASYNHECRGSQTICYGPNEIGKSRRS
jgi:hypothetical protein